MPWLEAADSFVMDFLIRKKVSLSVTNTVIDSLPFPMLRREDPRALRIVRLAAALTCTGPEMQAYWDMLAVDGWVAPGRPTPGMLDADMRNGCAGRAGRDRRG
jgi:hypothetical protein